MKSLPLCWHPSGVLILDNNINFMHSLQRGLKIDPHFQIPFLYPEKALEFLNEHVVTDPLLDMWLNKRNPPKKERDLTQINLDNLHEIIYSESRFRRLCVVVADYEMEILKGLKFYGHIRNPYVRKVLVTGVVNDAQAIEAFRNGEIHHFVRKQDTGMMQQINEAIVQMQQHYFHQMDGSVDPLLRNDIFIAFFHDMLQQHDIVEYYPYKGTRDFLLLDADGKTYGLFVRSASQNHTLVNTKTAATASDQVRDDLRKNRTMLCYPGAYSTTRLDGSQWGQYTQQATPMPTQPQKTDTFLYAVVPNALPVRRQDIVSLNTYKKDHSPAHLQEEYC